MVAEVESSGGYDIGFFTRLCVGSGDNRLRIKIRPLVAQEHKVEPTQKESATAQEMRAKLIIPTLFIIATVILVVFGKDFVENWKSFLIGFLFALSAIEIGKEIWRR